MKKLLLLILAILLFPSIAHAQVVIRFGWAAPPPVVEVSPGVQIVEDAGDEIFFTGGHYWVQREGRWYWASDYREHWVRARGPVPGFLRTYHHGDYLHWRRADHPGFRAGGRAEVRHEHVEHRAEVRHEDRAVEHHEERREEERH